MPRLKENKLFYSDMEIAVRFRCAKNKSTQIEIESDLNATTTENIVRALIRAGISNNDIPEDYRLVKQSA